MDGFKNTEKVTIFYLDPFQEFFFTIQNCNAFVSVKTFSLTFIEKK